MIKKKTVNEDLERIISHVYKFIEKNPGCEELDVSKYVSGLLREKYVGLTEKDRDRKHKDPDQIADYAIFSLKQEKAIRYVNGRLEIVPKEREAKKDNWSMEALFKKLGLYPTDKKTIAGAILLAVALSGGIISFKFGNATAMAAADNSEIGLSWFIALLLLLVLKYLFDKMNKKRR